jgi:tetratricopeptide (TPR) repeat protein
MPAIHAQEQGATGWGIQNQRVPWSQGTEGSALDGACYGMVRAQIEYRRLGLAAKRPFAEVTTPKASAATGEAGQRLFVEQFAGLAQNYALRGRNLETDVYSQPKEPARVDSSLAAAAPSPTNPQLLVLSNEGKAGSRTSPDFRAHAVMVENREDLGNQVRYTVSDPNHSGQRTSLIYDKTQGSFLGYEGYDTVRHDTTELPPQNRKWMDALIQGAAAPEKEKYLPVWRGNQDEPLPDAEYRKRKQTEPGLHILEVPAPSASLDQKMSVLRTAEVGGVRLFFDPVIVTSEDKAPQRWEMLHTLIEQVTAGNDNFLVALPGRDELHAVRLSAILRDAEGVAEPTVGDLTRITGFACDRKTGDLYILGREESGQNAIKLDVLTVALSAIYKQGLAPAISLDSDPRDPYGSVHPRLEQFPDEHRATEFTRIMFDSDYAMKRIMLGEDQLGIPGYQSSYDLLVSNPTGHKSEWVRWWLCPRQTSWADTYQTDAGNLQLFYFESDIELQTENMQQDQNLLVGTGERDPQEERAARLFTAYYEHIEELRPVFRDLQGLFDAAKLAFILRAKDIKSDALEQAASRPVAQVALKDAYAGIGPKPIVDSAGTALYTIGGGVQLRSTLGAGEVAKPAGLVDQSQLQALAREDADDVELTVNLPATVPLDASQVLEASSQEQISLAGDELRAANLDAAFPRLNAVLALNPASVPAHAMRAAVYLARGEYHQALQDADVVAKSDAAMQALRGQIRVFAGDPDGGLADVRAAAAASPDRRDVLGQKAWVEIQTLQWDQADKDIARITALAPLDRGIDDLRKDLRTLRRMDPQKARVFVKARLAIPLAVVLPLANAQAIGQAGDFDRALEMMEKLLATVQTQHAWSAEGVYIEDRLCIGIAALYYSRRQEKDPARARAYLQQVVKRHPDWPSPLLVQVGVDPEVPIAKALGLFEKTLSMSGGTDPLMLDSQVETGMDTRLNAGWQLVLRAMVEVDRDRSLEVATVRRLIDRVMAIAPPGAVKQALSMMRRSLDMTELERSGHKPNAGQSSRFQADMEGLALAAPALGPHPDPLNVNALEMFYGTAFDREASREKMTDADRQKDDTLFRNFVRTINSDWDSYDTLERAAKLSVRVHESYAQCLVRRMKSQPEFGDLNKLGGDGQWDTDKAFALLDHTADSVIGQLSGVPAFSQALLRAMLCTHYPELLGEAAKDQTAPRALLWEQKLIGPVQATPSGLVELRAASVWFAQEANTLPGRVADPAAAAESITEFYRLSTGLYLKFASRAAGM